jgi:hypothetical protein
VREEWDCVGTGSSTLRTPAYAAGSQRDDRNTFGTFPPNSGLTFFKPFSIAWVAPTKKALASKGSRRPKTLPVSYEDYAVARFNAEAMLVSVSSVCFSSARLVSSKSAASSIPSNFA